MFPKCIYCVNFLFVHVLFLRIFTFLNLQDDPVHLDRIPLDPSFLLALDEQHWVIIFSVEPISIR